MQSFHALEDQVATLRRQVESTETQLRGLKLQLQQAEQHAEAARHLEQAWAGGLHEDWINETLAVLTPSLSHDSGSHSLNPQLSPPLPGQKARRGTTHGRWPLANDEYTRYGRQLILPEIGLHGQLRLKKARVLIVGAGGLGCPAAAYLAGAGVGTLGLMDGDTVEVSNLHRQIAHSTSRVGMSKVDSAAEHITQLNPLVNLRSHRFHLTPEAAISIFQQYDLVLDCTDHPTSRYLISDACVLTGKPLVSASALKTEGQLIVLNNPPRLPGDPSGGPCYRCVFPKPPPAESIQSCSEGGILGPVVGVMGVLQALEALKLLTSKPPDIDDLLETTPKTTPSPTLLMFSAYTHPPFRSVRLRSRRSDCAVCSSQATITTSSLTTGSLNYITFCGVTSPLNLLSPDLRVSASDFASLPRNGSNMLIDVRDATQYAMCALSGSINIPWTGDASSWVDKAGQVEEMRRPGPKDCYIVCRVGNDSQLAARALLERSGSLPVRVRDIKGGFRAWREEVDAGWPVY